MKKYILFILSIFLFTCKSEESFLLKDDLIKLVAKDYKQEKVLMLNIFLFSDISDEYIGVIDALGLQKNYNRKDSIDYYNYVISVFNKSITFSCEDFYTCFVLNETIYKDFQNSDITIFLNKYVKKVSKDEYRLYSGTEKNEDMSILYCLFESGYFSCYDDYAGMYIIKRIDKSIS